MENLSKTGETGVEKKDPEGNLDWSRIEDTKAEIKSIFASIERNLNNIKAMTEIAKDRNFVISPESQKKADEILKKFEPYGEYAPVLYTMISDLVSINSMAFTEGLLVTAPELIQKLDEIDAREKDK